jgi:hypothetical protein
LQTLETQADDWDFMPRIIPEIVNGQRELVVTETCLIRPDDGMVIRIPLTPSPSGKQNNLELHVKFRPDVEITRFEVIAGNAMEVKIKTMPANATVGGFDKPLEFSLDNTRFEFFTSFVRVTASVVQMTLSIYRI